MASKGKSKAIKSSKCESKANNGTKGKSKVVKGRVLRALLEEVSDFEEFALHHQLDLHGLSPIVSYLDISTQG